MRNNLWACVKEFDDPKLFFPFSTLRKCGKRKELYVSEGI
jgi:hypothetical protein